MYSTVANLISADTVLGGRSWFAILFSASWYSGSIRTISLAVFDIEAAPCCYPKDLLIYRHGMPMYDSCQEYQGGIADISENLSFSST